MNNIIKKSILCCVSSFLLLVNVYGQRQATDKELQDRARQKVDLFNQYISTIADKELSLGERLSLSQNALSLFIGRGYSYEDNGVTQDGVFMEVSSVNRDEVKKRLMRNYLNGLANMRYKRVKIEHTDITDIKVSNLMQDPYDPDRFTCTCDIVQWFEGYGEDGRLQYYDKTLKRIKCYVIREIVLDTKTGENKNEYIVLLGDVQSLATTREMKDY